MKILFSIILLCTLVAASRAAVAIGFYKDPKHPGKCVVDGLILSSGEEAQNPPCGKMFCGDDGVVTFHTCGVIGAPPGHKQGERINPEAPYPGCCAREFIPE